MFYLGANDQRVTLVDENGREIYAADFRNFPAILTHLRPLIRAMALGNPTGEVDAAQVKLLEQQMQREKGFHSITTLSFTAGLDSRFLALVALAAAQQPKPAGKKAAKKKAR